MSTWKYWIFLIPTLTFGVPDRKVVLHFSRMDCIQTLVAAEGGTRGLIVMRVTSDRRIDKTSISSIDGFPTLISEPVRFVANWGIARGNLDVSDAIPGKGVVSERFTFGEVTGDKSKLRIIYDLEMKEGENTAFVHFDVEGSFSLGAWDELEKGRKVKFSFSESSLPCVERTIGAHLDRGGTSAAQTLFLAISCHGGTTNGRRREQNLSVPAFFEGSRSNMTFNGPAADYDWTMGLSDRNSED